MLVTEFLDDAVELSDADADDALIDEGLHLVRVMWDAGLAHRDIKPANLMVRDGHIVLIDVAFAELRPTPWRQAVDLANMMLCLALRSSAKRVYDRALPQFSIDEIAEAFAAARGLALPSQLRRALRADARDVHGEFIRLLPSDPGRSRCSDGPSAVAVALAPPSSWSFSRSIRLADSPTTAPAPPCRSAAVRRDGGRCGCRPRRSNCRAVPALLAASRVVVRRLTVNNGRSTITVDHDRAGPAHRPALRRNCDSPTPTEARPTFPALGATSVVLWTATAPSCSVVRGLRRRMCDRSPQLGHDRAGVLHDVTAQSRQVIGFVGPPSLPMVLDERSNGRLQLDPPT